MAKLAKKVTKEVTDKVTKEVTEEVSKQKQLEMAKKMLEEKLDINVISKVTGLSRKKIQEIADNKYYL